MGLFDDFKDAQMFALGDKIAKNGLSQAESPRYRCENCRSSQENSSGYLTCGYHGMMVLATQTCDEHTSRPGNAAPPSSPSPSPSYSPSSTSSTPPAARNTSGSSRSSSSNSRDRKFVSRLGGGAVGLLGGGIIAFIVIQVAYAVFGRHYSLEPIVGMGSIILFPLGGLYQGWVGELNLNKKLEYFLGWIMVLILAGIAVSKCLS